MTRINSSINVTHLTDEHLLAEHREIKRMVYSYLKRKQMSNGFNNLPEKFTLGKGHVLFFVDKGMFTFNRYVKLHEECLKRNFIVEDYKDNWLQYELKYFKDYVPRQEEHELLIERITERLLGSKKLNWHYYSKPISKQQSVELLNLGIVL